MTICGWTETTLSPAESQNLYAKWILHAARLLHTEAIRLSRAAAYLIGMNLSLPLTSATITDPAAPFKYELSGSIGFAKLFFIDAGLLNSATLSILQPAERILHAPGLLAGNDLFLLQDKLAFTGNALPLRSNSLAFIWFAKLLHRAAKLILTATLSILEAAKRILNAPELIIVNKLSLMQASVAFARNELPGKSNPLAFIRPAKLLDDALQKYQLNKDENAGRSIAYDAFYNKWQEMDEIYTRHRKIS
jgi:hypothetical protein